MRTPDLLPLLEEFHRERLAMTLSHIAGARLVAQYDFNNTYQYIVNRDETHLSWLVNAIAGLGGTPSADAAEPAREASGKGEGRAHGILEADAREAGAFVERWRSRVEGMEDARHRGMLRVILGEVLEQKRFFEQALAGRKDLLGRRAEQIVGPAIGEVLPTRWVE